MQRPQDTIGSGRWLGLLGVSALAMLSGCDWISGSTPIGPPPRPGVEREIAPVSAIPPAPGNRQYDAPVTAADETRTSTPAIGSIVAGKGGQKAQKEALEKEQAEHDRKDREARDERDAAEKEAKRKEKEAGTSGVAPAVAPVGAPPVGAGSITSDPPVSAPVPPPAPVTGAPIAPPSAAPDPATPGAPAVTPESLPVPTPPPADPNKAFAPQPGWTPPGTNVGSVMTLAPLTVAFTTSASGVDDACGEAVATPTKGDPARAQSGEVPFSALKSPPFGGPLQVAVIQFGHASAGLDETDYAVLARVAEIQRDNGGIVRIVAHSAENIVAASRAGIERGSFDISRRRALAVGQQLRRLGVPADQIVAEAASNDEPIYQTSTARGIAANRRADVFIDF